MRPVSPEEKPNPLQDANFCSRLFSWWLNPLFKIGYERKLNQDDLYSVLPEDRSQHLGEELKGYWDQEVLRAKKDAREPSLMKAITSCYWKFCLVLGLLTFLEEGTKVVLPIFLGKIIGYVENYDPANFAALHEAYGYAAGLSACVLVWAVLHHLCFYHMQRVGMRLRVAVCHMIYRKSLHLSSLAMGKTTTGQIVNLMSNDVYRFDQVTMSLHYLWVGPLQAIAVTALLWMEIGISCLAGMAVLIILLLLQSCVGNSFSSLRSKTAALTDDRIRTMSEVITGIKTIKMNAWEKSLIDLITRLRRKEISKILKSSYLRGMNLASFFAISKIMIFVTFITNELLDMRITASQVFVVVTLIEALRFSSTLYFPMAVEKVSEAVVSIRRIKNFLLLDEIPELHPQRPSDGERIVDMQDFTAFWDEESETPALQGLSFTVRPGELLAVVGPVGAGKSSLLRALLGELPPSQGKVSVHGRIAYVSQQPWVFPGTVRSNILFGNKYEEEWYEEVIRACALEETENIQVILAPEDYLEGKVGFKTYENYFTAHSDWPVIIFLILVNIAAQVAYVLQDWWLAFWANVQSGLYFGTYVKEAEDVMFVLNWYLGVYSGRILNRFSKDIGHMDELLPQIFQDFIQISSKDGIVGRTGAGKSSFIAALLRLSEPEGSIWIDGIKTTSIGLHDLRKKMSVAPQVQLKDTFEHLPGKMNTELAESGLNLSVGQRQLVCLARTILKKNQILIIDKATSNVDPRTDELIQKKIREKFSHCTVLTITHRLSNVIDCQRILVLDSGERKETGRPNDLLQNRNSLFYKMVQQLGKEEVAVLSERAK
ncbi:hypothetical protein MJG53_009990 [Ovis ammon polii x Ovis aries]|uniref:Uncharacterized protein n=1 Tax=Ovis ammon polii x Ovis aries TaxID=2918886 RepID=A0ACB9UVL4_9CETA|nr:hypothetical protein MJG53_009990 [Ovis ammon polii x Ovis aries]